MGVPGYTLNCKGRMGRAGSPEASLTAGVGEKPTAGVFSGATGAEGLASAPVLEIPSRKITTAVKRTAALEIRVLTAYFTGSADEGLFRYAIPLIAALTPRAAKATAVALTLAIGSIVDLLRSRKSARGKHAEHTAAAPFLEGTLLLDGHALPFLIRGQASTITFLNLGVATGEGTVHGPLRYGITTLWDPGIVSITAKGAGSAISIAGMRVEKSFRGTAVSAKGNGRRQKAAFGALSTATALPAPGAEVNLSSTLTAICMAAS